jgi:hypothetical protein
MTCMSQVSRVRAFGQSCRLRQDTAKAARQEELICRRHGTRIVDPTPCRAMAVQPEEFVPASMRARLRYADEFGRPRSCWC